jgi:hypothetical protein
MAAKKGSVNNPKGAPPGPRLKKSKLRKTEEKLLLLQDQAFKNISDSVNGISVDKEILSSSKWTVNTLVTVSRAALTEEATLNELRLMVKGEEPPAPDADEDKQEVVPRFSLDYLPTKADLERPN